VLDPGHQVVQAFEWQGKTYYKFANEYNLPWERMQVAVGLIEEDRLRVDAGYVQATLAAVKEQLDKRKTGEAYKWLNALEERLSWPFDVDLVYRLAAVVFFDESENPYGYDAAYAYSKIQAWRLADREAEQLRRFFSLLGLEHYLGPLTDAGIDLKPYSEAQRKIKLSQLSQLCTLLYAQQKTAAWYSSIRQEATALRALQP
jgi:hypothetical protein